jgi:hypothetical protein
VVQQVVLVVQQVVQVVQEESRGELEVLVVQQVDLEVQGRLVENLL